MPILTLMDISCIVTIFLTGHIAWPPCTISIAAWLPTTPWAIAQPCGPGQRWLAYKEEANM
ncbi:uncharacterized protein MYCFIDRAFT_170962 [Pseudocercospora fijiensis CIRAD86]|uniref:Uncharacterized protein n=1 Tax=Pseudocercospora fijiensis (strain CIRAD86) TaxID=383855 RepID=N1QCZ9_PSEFD|nr:uncharacterized protein MYCFIDRAFT_170962 [Pseudocercospora fijiensis CIRAD86]EME89513.1 hypothetical protein MYCFIDRAFT_170962 [Pseudocercospora fijiensis CIRAD86]